MTRRIHHAHVVPENGADFTAKIANLTPNSLFIKTVQSFQFRETVTVTFFSVSVEATVVFISRRPPGVVVVFDTSPEVRRLIEARVPEIEVLDLSRANPYEGNAEITERMTHSSELDENVPATAPMGQPPLLMDDDYLPRTMEPGETISERPPSQVPTTYVREVPREVLEDVSAREQSGRDERLKQLTVPGRPLTPSQQPEEQERDPSEPEPLVLRKRAPVPPPPRPKAARRLRTGEPITELDPKTLMSEESPKPELQDEFDEKTLPSPERKR